MGTSGSRVCGFSVGSGDTEESAPLRRERRSRGGNDYVHRMDVPLGMSPSQMSISPSSGERKKRRKSVAATLRSMYKRVFLQLDGDGDGCLDRGEFEDFYIVLLRSTGHPKRQAQEIAGAKYNGVRRVDSLFAHFDETGKGRVGFTEFWKDKDTAFVMPKGQKKVTHAQHVLINWKPPDPIYNMEETNRLNGVLMPSVNGANVPEYGEQAVINKRRGDGNLLDLDAKDMEILDKETWEMEFNLEEFRRNSVSSVEGGESAGSASAEAASSSSASKHMSIKEAVPEEDYGAAYE